MGNQIYFKIAGKVDLDMLNMFAVSTYHLSLIVQICVFGADLKSNMAARAHNVFSLVEILKILLETTKPIEL
jgi:hypothetical protein